MIYVPDTHALVWYLIADKRLGAHAKTALTLIDQGEHQGIISALVLAEIMYLEERGRIQVNLDELIANLRSNANYSIVPFDSEILRSAKKLKNVPELFDRMIAATAIYFGAILLTRDHVFSESRAIKTVW
jgi:PIN domain nuclease of toxin-antitoxin system